MSTTTSRPSLARHVRAAAAPVVSLLGIAGVAYWASRQDAPMLPSGATALALLALACAAYLGGVAVRGWRWRGILHRAGEAQVGLDALGLETVGYMGNSVLPARGGEVLRIVLLRERHGVAGRAALSSVVVERLLDVVALVLLLVVMTLAGVGGAPTGIWPVVAGVVAAVAAAAVALAYHAARRRGRLSGVAERLAPYAAPVRALAGRGGAVLLAWSLGSWLVEGLAYALSARALDLHIGLLDGVLIAVLAAFLTLIPAAPGFVGTFDAAVLFGLGARDVHDGAAVGYVLVVRLVVFGPVTVAGLVLLLTRYGGLGRLRRRS